MARPTEQATSSTSGNDGSPTMLARNLLVTCKRGDPTDWYRTALATATDDDLHRV